VKKKVIATTAPLILSQTTVTASQPGGIVTTVGGIVPEQIRPPTVLELLEIIASLEKELEAVRARNKVSTDDYVTEGDDGLGNAASGPLERSAIFAE